ncbi:hypothetical protein BDQ94DRAFT_134475 [Aspergillus welwitschiae]|uniref:Uncharacterized protein n=1 Tax=Aspergillus welwitschiae TaxID=1341132 RepID=A0A3F3QHD5_9EURO|nr:hypothetical protein BDQ94DRAFT_134475 [Aspergillus welwitschiae]RDH38714.1 hypothetical protein BDQ94DRAFT_134475 [Aspergillus welwitschiae]
MATPTAMTGGTDSPAWVPYYLWCSLGLKKLVCVVHSLSRCRLLYVGYSHATSEGMSDSREQLSF